MINLTHEAAWTRYRSLINPTFAASVAMGAEIDRLTRSYALGQAKDWLQRADETEDYDRARDCREIARRFRLMSVGRTEVWD